LVAETVTREKLKPYMDLETRVTRLGKGMTLGRGLRFPASNVVRSAAQPARLWWVNQGKTFLDERSDGYVFATPHATNGTTRRDHETLKQLQRGDTILHYAPIRGRRRGFVRSLSEVTEPYRTAPRPIPRQDLDSGQPGYLVKVTYHDTPQPVALDEIPLEWRTEEGGPFMRSGGVNQGYLYPLSEAFKERFVATFGARWPAPTSPDDTDD
jgi:5-methylcytosine-specific restriction enzyme B